MEPGKIVGSVLTWFAGIVLSITLVFVVLALLATAIVAIYDLFSGHRPLVGIGYVFAIGGAFIGVVAAFGLFNISEKTVMTRGANIPPAVFYNTIFSPVMLAMRSTPRTYYDNSLVVAVASLLLFLFGLILLG